MKKNTFKPVGLTLWGVLLCAMLCAACGGSAQGSVEAAPGQSEFDGGVPAGGHTAESLAALSQDQIARLLGKEPSKKRVSPKSAKKSSAQVTPAQVTAEFYVMSKCPFGVKVLNSIIPIAKEMGGALDLQVDYIGRKRDGVLTSMHGQPEVAGDMLQLCAKAHGTRDQWLDFIACQNENWRKIPGNGRECGAQVGLDVEQLITCYQGEEGQMLLSKSFNKASARGATGSPTIYLNDAKYQGGRSEKVMSRQICGLMNRGHPMCERLPALNEVAVTVVTDVRCTTRRCQPRGFISAMSRLFEKPVVTELDYSDDAGRAAFERSGAKTLPVVIFGANLVKDEEAFRRLKRGDRLVKIEDAEDYRFVLGQWDPTAEICDDGIDNTDNGKVDCADETCVDVIKCRKVKPKKLDIFVMSQCPYAVQALKEMETVLKHFKNKRRNIDFEIGYIGSIDPNGELNSLHGQREVAEDLRQICAQKYYPQKYKFVKYISCRNRAWEDNRGNEDDDAWKSCVPRGAKAKVIEKCATGDEGKQLLTKSFERARKLNFSGSPSFLLNNSIPIRVRTSADIKTRYCEANPKAGRCSAEMKTEQKTAPANPAQCGSN